MERIPANQDNDLKYYEGLFNGNQNPKIKKYKSLTDDEVLSESDNDDEEKLEYFTE